MHNRIKATCKEPGCGGASFCEHGILRHRCVQCGGASICMHNKRREICKLCGGSSICMHNKLRYICKDCDGAKICVHDKQKEFCNECNNFTCDMEPCSMQGHRFAGAYSLKHHMQTFHSDNPKALTKSKELELHQALQNADICFEYQKHLPFRGCGLASETMHAYIDFCIQMTWGVILLECDENQHHTYDPSCDVRRDFDSCASIALGSQHKAVVLRYNPDAFKIGGATRRTTKKERQQKLLETIMSWEEDPAPQFGFARFFLFYDAADDAAPLPLIAENWSEEVRAVTRRLG